MLKWFFDNIEWLFSGVGIIILVSIFRYFLGKKSSGSDIYHRSTGGDDNSGSSNRERKESCNFFQTLKLWWYHRCIASIVTNGLVFFEQQLLIAAERGGEIFTTAIFENYSQGDKIREQILKIRIHTHKKPKHLRFTRLVFLDDPTQELAWISDFLLLKSKVIVDSNGFVFHPVIWRIPSSNRSFMHRLMNSLPRITLTLIKRNDPEQYFVYLGFPNPPSDQSANFGLVFQSRVLYEKTMNFITKYSSAAGPLHIQTYTETQQLPNIDFSERGLTTRIIDVLQELAQTRTDICHIGLFGSQSLVFQRRIALQEKIPYEADLDLLVVIDRRASLVLVKQVISQCILQQKLEANTHMEIEWSNLDGRYYEYRRGYHVDIQIHFAQDDYYVNKATLLGYSIFDGFYTVLHSANDEPVFRYLQIPQRPLCQIDRIALVLDAPEYGLRTAIERIGHVNYIQSTDTKRVLWISLANIVWALAGESPITKASALEFLSKYKDDLGILSDLIVQAKQHLETPSPHTPEHARQLHNSCRGILKDLEKLLEDNLR